MLAEIPRSRPRVYFLHGLLTASRYHYAPQLSAWRETYALSPIDLPGHGTCRRDASIPYVASAVAYALAIIDALGSGHIVAASYLGCPVAVRCARARPHAVRSLVLTGFSPGVEQPAFERWVESFSLLAEQNQALREWYERMHGARWRETLTAYACDARERYDDIAVGYDMLAGLQVPALLLNGSLKSNEREAAQRAAGLHSAGLRGRILEGAGHAPGRDRAEAFNAAVGEFWSEIPDAQLAVG